MAAPRALVEAGVEPARATAGAALGPGPPAWAWRALILAAPVGLMLRSFLGGHGVGGGDLELLYQPFWDYLGRSLRQGRLPLWDPDLGVGVPFLASMQSQALYPPAALLFTLLPLHVASFVFLFGHFYFAGFGTERLARRLGWSGPSAAGAGALVACAPMLLSSITRPNMVTAVAWLPWTLIAADRLCARRRGGIAALAACVALGLLCAAPEITFLGVLLVGGYALLRAARGDRWTVPRCLLAGAAGVALAAVVLLPLAELLRQSTRAVDVQGMEGAWALGWADLASLLLPFLNLGASLRNFQEIYFGRYQTFICVLYLGTPAVLLSAVAVRRGGRREWLLVAVAAAALLLGAQGGELSLALQWLHLGAVTWRYPVKFIYPAAFAVALLAALGAERISEEASGGRLLPVLAVAGGLLMAGGIAVLRFDKPLGLSLAWVAAGLMALSAILRWVPGGPWRHWALIAFCVFESGLCALRTPFADKSSNCAGLFEAAKRRAGSGRVDATPGDAVDPVAEPGWQSHCLLGNLVAESGLPSVRFYGTPWPQGSEALVGTAGSIGDGLLGVTLLLRGRAEAIPGVVPIDAPELAPLWAAALPGAAPRVELRPSARVTHDTEAALLQEPLEQARREVLLNLEPPPPSAPGEPYTGPDLAKLVADRGEQVEIDTASGGERYLVLADLYYRGWTATVDGLAAPIRVAYGMLRTLRLGPGRHHVLFDYRPLSFRLGRWITLLSMAALAAGMLVRRPT